MKTEILVQMDGLAKTEDLVFLLAASNLPWYVLSSYCLVNSDWHHNISLCDKICFNF